MKKISRIFGIIAVLFVAILSFTVNATTNTNEAVVDDIGVVIDDAQATMFIENVNFAEENVELQIPDAVMEEQGVRIVSGLNVVNSNQILATNVKEESLVSTVLKMPVDKEMATTKQTDDMLMVNEGDFGSINRLSTSNSSFVNITAELATSVNQVSAMEYCKEAYRLAIITGTQLNVLSA